MKLKSFLVCLGLLLSSTSALAATLTVGTATYSAGGTVTVPVTLTGGTNISIVSLDINYDVSKLSNPVAVLDPAASAKGKALYSNGTFSPPQPGKFRILIAGRLTENPNDPIKGGSMDDVVNGKSSVLGDVTVANVTFNVAAGTTGPITLGLVADASDQDANPVIISGVMPSPITPGSGTAGKPGDCDNNGRVSVIEVQNATNMLLRKIPVLQCADPNSDGRVSVIEIQNMVNALLGKPF